MFAISSVPLDFKKSDRASNFRMALEDQHAFPDPVQVFKRRRGISPGVEFEDALQVRERFLVENDHAMRRDFGRTAALPSARCPR